MTSPDSPIRALSFEHRRRLLVLLLASAAIFCAIAVVVQLRLFIDVEWEAQRLVQTLRTRPLESPMRGVSLLASGWVLYPLAVVGCLTVYRLRHASLALAMTVVAASGMVATNLAKLLVIRQRPNTVLWAFPSSHTFGIVIFIGLVFYLLWALEAPARWRRATLVGGSVIVLAVGASRLYLNAHWVGDVLGGLAGGLAFVLGGVLLIDQRIRAVPAATVDAPRAFDTVTG
jgi:undecaprenyl-diphosphatase